MTLLRDIDESTPLTPAAKESAPKQPKGRNGGPVGAPTETHAHSVLLTLRSRLQAQIEESDEYESAETRAIFADARYRLAQVNEALERMEEGKYGLCVECNAQINADRLVIQPFATRCLGCQERHDRKVRRGPGLR